MLFRQEAEMRSPVLDWLRSQQLTAKSEFVTPWGVCDLVGVAFDESQVTRRLFHDQRRAIGAVSRVAILNAIPGPADCTYVTLQGLLSRLNGAFAAERLRAHLDYLISSNFVVCPRQNAYQKVADCYPLHRRIIAVELKLSRVNAAISQALSHLAFTPESFVALPSDLAHRIRDDQRRHHFERTGLGLLAVSPRGCEVLFSPNSDSRLVDPVLQVAFMEKFWRTQLTNSSS
jgi:hypothetical protein